MEQETKKAICVQELRSDMTKPPLEDIKYLGKMFAQDAWGNNDAEKMIKWYQSQLKREMDKNESLEMENFRLSIKRPSFFRFMFNYYKRLFKNL